MTPRSLKVAMLAAATPYTSFSGSSVFPGGTIVPNLDLLISVHPNDRAITKLGILGCERFGASCLGARREDVCTLSRELQRTGRVTTVTGYDFRRDERAWGKEAKAHDFSVYLKQASQHSSFLRDFMAAGSPAPQTGREGGAIACS
jgi:hypothetical protein